MKREYLVYKVQSKLAKYQQDVEKQMLEYDAVVYSKKISDGLFLIQAERCTDKRWESFGFKVIPQEKTLLQSALREAVNLKKWCYDSSVFSEGVSTDEAEMLIDFSVELDKAIEKYTSDMDSSTKELWNKVKF